MKKNQWQYIFTTLVAISRRSHVKNSVRSNATLNIENNDKYCFLWSILAYLHPCNSNHSNRASNYRQFLKEISIKGFDFTNAFKCSGVHKFEKPKKFNFQKFWTKHLSRSE